jgi:hypothetical protein
VKVTPISSAETGATLAVSASGEDLQYQWIKDNTPIKYANNTKYKTTALGHYQCDVTSLYTNNVVSSNIVVVSDAVPPSSSLYVKLQSPPELDTYALQCRVGDSVLVRANAVGTDVSF